MPTTTGSLPSQPLDFVSFHSECLPNERLGRHHAKSESLGHALPKTGNGEIQRWGANVTSN